MENYYDILGVSETSTQDEIKKAYRKMAIEHHPDKGGDENTFKKISEAYDTIGDEGKRQQYDSQKNNPFGGSGFNPFGDMFDALFGFHNNDKSLLVRLLAKIGDFSYSIYLIHQFDWN